MADVDDSEFDITNVPAETPLSPEEAIMRRHRREKKELQGKIVAMKKSITKNDKKKKKELADEIAKLESDLETRHKLELDAFRPGRMEMPESSETITETNEVEPEVPIAKENGPVDEAPGTPARMSKARRKREKKEAEEKERRKRIDSETETLVQTSESKKEDEKLAEILKGLSLEIVDIPSDGHCLYKAISHQLEQQNEKLSIQDLRNMTGIYLQENKEEFINFFDERVALSDTAFESYCQDIIDTASWGGQIEVQVISQVLQRPITVIQADGSPIKFGENFSKPELKLTYHRHRLALGAHYNSAVVKG